MPRTAWRQPQSSCFRRSEGGLSQWSHFRANRKDYCDDALQLGRDSFAAGALDFTVLHALVSRLLDEQLKNESPQPAPGSSAARRQSRMARIRNSAAAALLTRAQSSVRSDLKNSDNGHHREDPEHQHFKYDCEHSQPATNRSNNKHTPGAVANSRAP